LTAAAGVPDGAAADVPGTLSVTVESCCGDASVVL
jgi:hypothetical protein